MMTPGSSDPSASPLAGRARVLVIEDNAANLELMTYLLNAFGHTTMSATSGEDGVAAALREIPDLILCDIALPGLDGYGVAARLKAEPSVKGVPLIAVTASAMVGDRDRVIAMGFDGYIAKPITPETFVTELRVFCPGEVRHSHHTDCRRPARQP